MPRKSAPVGRRTRTYVSLAHRIRTAPSCGPGDHHPGPGASPLLFGRLAVTVCFFALVPRHVLLPTPASLSSASLPPWQVASPHFSFRSDLSSAGGAEIIRHRWPPLVPAASSGGGGSREGRTEPNLRITRKDEASSQSTSKTTHPKAHPRPPS